jgi:hypothetical protein
MVVAMNTAEVMAKSDSELLAMADTSVRDELGLFMREFNKREWSVRIAKSSETFDEYAQQEYEHRPEFGRGFVVDGKPVPYFHPNRSFHDEVIWLNKNLYFNPAVNFEDKIVNSAIVKFYGPSKTLEIVSGHADLPYLEKTPWPFVNVAETRRDPDYYRAICENVEKAVRDKQQIWGTTELRTSLQTAARQHSRARPGPLDQGSDAERKFKASDMIHWVVSMTESGDDINGIHHQGFNEFYSQKPTMEQSYDFLTARRGIGAYYGYHFSSNLSRMPGVGSAALIDREYDEAFKTLQSTYPDLTHGNLDENDGYVVAGPGATDTLSRLWPGLPMNQKTTMKLINAIKEDQEQFFGIVDGYSLRHLNEASELGRFTTFGIEISCCQYSVFNRLKNDRNLAAKRAAAPISKEIGESPAKSLADFF